MGAVGFELAAYAVGWVPYVGWLAPQIMIFYNFGERIVRSITFNVADWLGGSISFWQGLANVVVDTINSFIYFANDAAGVLAAAAAAAAADRSPRRRRSRRRVDDDVLVRRIDGAGRNREPR